MIHSYSSVRFSAETVSGVKAARIADVECGPAFSPARRAVPAPPRRRRGAAPTSPQPRPDVAAAPPRRRRAPRPEVSAPEKDGRGSRATVHLARPEAICGWQQLLELRVEERVPLREPDDGEDAVEGGGRAFGARLGQFGGQLVPVAARRRLEAEALAEVRVEPAQTSRGASSTWRRVAATPLPRGG